MFWACKKLTVDTNRNVCIQIQVGLITSRAAFGEKESFTRLGKQELDLWVR